VLEHVPDPHVFLRGIRRLLRPGGVGLIEVPCLEQALRGGRFYDFFPDHLNYFSARTLRFALERNGFEVLRLQEAMNGEYLEAWVRVATPPNFPLLQATVRQIAADLHTFLVAQKAAGHRVAVWGAGGKGLAVLAVTGIADVAYVVDSDPHKQGFYTPVSHLPIVPPNQLQTEPVDAIILTAIAYRDEILHTLRTTWGFRGPVAVLGPRLEILGPDEGNQIPAATP
jgi:hypothetical protein